MATLSHMSFHPMKSGAGIVVTTALLTEAGLVVEGIAPRRKSALALAQRRHPLSFARPTHPYRSMQAERAVFARP